MPFLSSRYHFWLGIGKMIAWQQGRKWGNQSCPESSLSLSFELYLEGVRSPRVSIGGLQMGRIPWVAFDRSQENTCFSAFLGGMERRGVCSWLQAGPRDWFCCLLCPPHPAACLPCYCCQFSCVCHSQAQTLGSLPQNLHTLTIVCKKNSWLICLPWSIHFDL